MMPLTPPIAVVSPYVTGAYALVGSLIGGLIAVVVAWQARKAAERAWIRDSRRDIYDRFLTSAQKLLVVCEAAEQDELAGGTEETTELKNAVESAHADFFEVYSVVQTVAERKVVDAARIYAYRLGELKSSLDSESVLAPEPETFSRVAQLIRLARHETIDAMRAELGLKGSARPPLPYNPFAGTDLEEKYAATGGVQPGPRGPVA